MTGAWAEGTPTVVWATAAALAAASFTAAVGGLVWLEVAERLRRRREHRAAVEDALEWEAAKRAMVDTFGAEQTARMLQLAAHTDRSREEIPGLTIAQRRETAIRVRQILEGETWTC